MSWEFFNCSRTNHNTFEYSYGLSVEHIRTRAVLKYYLNGLTHLLLL